VIFFNIFSFSLLFFSNVINLIKTSRYKPNRQEELWIYCHSFNIIENAHFNHFVKLFPRVLKKSLISGAKIVQNRLSLTIQLTISAATAPT